MYPQTLIQVRNRRMHYPLTRSLPVQFPDTDILHQALSNGIIGLYKLASAVARKRTKGATD